jgi:hypothetical protein
MANPAPTGPRELGVAARAATLLAYAIALVGTGGGTLSLRDGDLATALIVWTTSLAVAATLVGMATLLRAVEGLSRRLAGVERALDDDQRRGSRSSR